MSKELDVVTKCEVVERKILAYEATIYDQTIELRVMERIKDAEGTKRVKEALVRLELAVDELERIRGELAKDGQK